MFVQSAIKSLKPETQPGGSESSFNFYRLKNELFKCLRVSRTHKSFIFKVGLRRFTLQIFEKINVAQLTKAYQFT